MNNSIAIVTTVSNKKLYNKTVATFPDSEKLYIIDGSKGFFGLKSILFSIQKLKKEKDIKWLVLCDEDVVFANVSAFYSLVKFMEKKSIDVCGIRDGGMLSWRDKNPYLINPFFSIYRFDKITEIFNYSKIISQPKISENEFNDDLTKLKFDYDKLSNFEEYYCFILWLRRANFNFHFLKAESNLFENDLETTTVYNQKDELILYHTWYARTYEKNKFHTKRINEILEKGVFIDGEQNREIKVLSNHRFNLTQNLLSIKIFKKIYKKIKNY